MEKLPRISCETSSELANALSDNLTLESNPKSNLDVIYLHPDEHDEQVTTEVTDINEVIAKTIPFLYNQTNKSLFFTTKDQILNPEGTQPPRAPRPMFMGPVNRNRRSRGARKNQKNGNEPTNRNPNDAAASHTSTNSTDNKPSETIATTNAQMDTSTTAQVAIPCTCGY